MKPTRMRLSLFVVALLSVSAVAVLETRAYSDTTLADCYARQDGDKLIIGNAAMERTFDLGSNQLKAMSIRCGDIDFSTGTKRPGFALGDVTKKSLRIEWKASMVEQSPTVCTHLQVEVIESYRQVDVKRVYRVYPKCSAIGCDFYVRRTSEGPVEFDPQKAILQSLGLPGRHWRFAAAEFFDRTDSINNLVAESSCVGYSRPTLLRGNVLLATPLNQDGGLFFVKEAPCSFVQLHYPGHDFSCSMSEVQVIGAGIAPADLPQGEWIRVYSVATGVCDGSELGYLTALRDYQKRLRLHEPERDDMIMMNTWGDRNRDARVGEAFVNEQVDACRRLGVSHLQIDDGWQQGLSKNSASSSGRLWDQWTLESWQPHGERFPNGFPPVVDYAAERGVKLGLWFHPSNSDDYASWKDDAAVVVDLYRKFGVRYFKIDGIKLPTKRSEVNLRRFLDAVLQETDSQVVFNLDATADNRGGYHYFYEYGNIFLENRYTDFGRYYPHWTLRNLWMLSKYVPPERLQIEFLNKWRNADKYLADDPLAPQRIPFDYQFAVTMAAQPLAWFEGSNLPDEAFEIAPLVKKYREIQADFHAGCILPIGDEPSGTGWTGFQSMRGDQGYLLVFREWNNEPSQKLVTRLPAGQTVRLTHALGAGGDFETTVDPDGRIEFLLPARHSFGMYRYEVIEE